MKKSILLLFALFIFGMTNAQNIKGKAFYESKTTVDMENFGGREMSEDMKKQILERMKNYLEKTFVLTFNGKESIYREEEKLEAGTGNQGFGMMMSSFSAGDQYKNLETGQFLEEREFFGKQFLINDSIQDFQWEIGKESKQIGQYLAIKATAVKKVDPNDFSMMRRRSDRDRADEDKKEGIKKTDTTRSDDPFDEIEIPKEVIVTAWFTPQIPVQNGPGEYAGLPGLILELNVDRTTLLCSKIVLNTKESDAIAPPDKGTELTREAYNKIVKEKTEEMRENFRGSGGGRRGGNRRFGG